MNVIEIEKDNYLFSVDQDPEKKIACIFKWTNGELRLVQFARLVLDNHLKEQLHLIADKFLENKGQLDHDGYSVDDILRNGRMKFLTGNS
ncbi:hypothetical protein [Virgibacillus kimchii]